MGATPAEFKFNGCKVEYLEGTISLVSDRDPADRLVWTLSNAESAAQVFRFLAPELARAIRLLASQARMARMNDRHSVDH